MDSSMPLPWSTGLPGTAVERIRRQAESGMAGSLLSVPAAAALASAGWVPLGEVMGCAVIQQVARKVLCPPQETGTVGRPMPTWRRVDAMGNAYQGYDRAVARLRQEAAGLDATGVVGISLTTTTLGNAATGLFGSSGTEYVALGTAVRDTTQPTPGNLFVTDLTGEDVTALAASGWRPVGFGIGLSIEAEHLGRGALMAISAARANFELQPLSHMLTRSRASALVELRRRASSPGAQHLVISIQDTVTSMVQCQANSSDAQARTTMIGTSLSRVQPGADPGTGAGRPLTVLPLEGASTAARRGRVRAAARGERR